MTTGGLSKAMGLAVSLWLAMGLKLAVTLVWVVWKGEERRLCDIGV